MENLRRALGGGPRLWVKREDCSGLALGGNKVRKLDTMLGSALTDGVDTLITSGAIQSNHARQTAAAAARLGIDCHLVLSELVARSDELYRKGGNRLLDDLLGATVHEIGDGDRDEVTAEVASRLRSEGRHPAVIPLGGSSDLGAASYVGAVEEWVEQGAPHSMAVDHVYVAASTAGTLAGIANGAARLEPGATVHGIAVSDDADFIETAARRLSDAVDDVLAEHDHEPVGRLDHLVVDGSQIGPGYGQPTDAMIEAVSLFARHEGLLLDPVYSGKAAAALVADIRSGAIDGGNVLFVHTGGAPGIFAYGQSISLSSG